MENFQGTIGSVTVGVLKAGLKPDTAVQLIVCFQITEARLIDLILIIIGCG